MNETCDIFFWNGKKDQNKTFQKTKHKTKQVFKNTLKEGMTMTQERDDSLDQANHLSKFQLNRKGKWCEPPNLHVFGGISAVHFSKV